MVWRLGRAAGPPEVRTTKLADGVWDVRIANGGSGGAVIEFADHLVMFEPYGNEAETFARIDAANRLVRGKQVTATVVSHHHDDHAGGLRAAVARGLTIIAQRRTQALFEEWVSRPAVLFPDALARNPRPLKFVGRGREARAWRTRSTASRSTTPSATSTCRTR